MSRVLDRERERDRLVRDVDLVSSLAGVDVETARGDRMSFSFFSVAVVSADVLVLVLSVADGSVAV